MLCMQWAFSIILEKKTAHFLTISTRKPSEKLSYNSVANGKSLSCIVLLSPRSAEIVSLSAAARHTSYLTVKKKGKESYFRMTPPMPRN